MCDQEDGVCRVYKKAADNTLLRVCNRFQQSVQHSLDGSREAKDLERLSCEPDFVRMVWGQSLDGFGDRSGGQDVFRRLLVVQTATGGIDGGHEHTARLQPIHPSQEKLGGPSLHKTVATGVMPFGENV